MYKFQEYKKARATANTKRVSKVLEVVGKTIIGLAFLVVAYIWIVALALL